MSDPAVTFGATVEGVRVLKTGEVSIRLNVPVTDAQKALALGLFMGYYFEQVAMYAPSKEQEA